MICDHVNKPEGPEFLTKLYPEMGGQVYKETICKKSAKKNCENLRIGVKRFVSQLVEKLKILPDSISLFLLANLEQNVL